MGAFTREESEELQQSLRESLAPFKGRHMDARCIEQMKQVLLEHLVRMERYEPLLPAREMRQMGIYVPDRFPDQRWLPVRNIRVTVEADHHTGSIIANFHYTES